MTLTDELKIFDGKIKENQPQYNLDREADKMSALDEYKYDNDLMHNSARNFNKYSVPYFNEISSIDSKFDTINKILQRFFKIKRINKQIRRKRLY